MGAGNSSALQASDFILIFLSRNSVAKRGYVQREMKLALDAWQELPEGTIHTIPVRLDDCVVPEPFRRYHYANLFDSRGFERLTRAIHTGLTQRQHFAPESALEPPPDPIQDREPPSAGAGRRSVADASVSPPREPESTPVSQPQKPCAITGAQPVADVVMALEVSRVAHFPLALVSPLRYTMSVRLTL